MYQSRYLEHHGIKGQKWGVRRFQNEDRTWTEAGKIRYGRGTGGRASGTLVNLDEKKMDKINSEIKVSDMASINRGKQCVTDILSREGMEELTSSSKIVIPKGMSIVDAYQRQYMSNANEEAANNNRLGSEIEKESGLPLKGNKQYTEEQDIAMVNPGYSNFDENTKTNCVLCSMTYELRKRGYDVISKKTISGVPLTERQMSRWFKDPKVEHVDGGYYSNFTKDKKLKDLSGKEISDAINKHASNYGNYAQKVEKQLIGDGSDKRGMLSADMLGFSHAVFYEVKNGKLTVIDSQSGKKYNGMDWMDCSGKGLSQGNPVLGVSYMRMDNLDLNKDNLKEICQ